MKAGAGVFVNIYTITMPIVFLLFGLIVGSFLNVLVYRLKDAETLLGRSFCRHCKRQIRWYDNVPLLSFVLLRGECRDCTGKISWQYPAVEGLTGILFAVVGILFFDVSSRAAWIDTAWLLGLASLFVTIAAYDMRYMEIPVALIAAAGLWTLLRLALAYRPGMPFWSNEAVLAVFGSLVVGGLFFALVWASKETWMGWGDVWLGFAVGLAVGLPLALIMLTVSFALGAAVGLGLMAFRGKTLKTQIPFAPFLVAGAFLTLLLPRVAPELLRYFFF